MTYGAIYGIRTRVFPFLVSVSEKGIKYSDTVNGLSVNKLKGVVSKYQFFFTIKV